jgi:phosphomannomutase
MQFASANPPKDLLSSPIDKIQTFDGVKYTARCGSWLMLRGSGTEPVLRIYAEGPTQPCVARLLDLGQSIANRANR